MQKRYLTLLFLCAFLSASCTTFRQSTVANVKDFNVPKEIENKFEVTDTKEPIAPAQPVAVAQQDESVQKAKKKKTKKMAKPAEVAGFAARSATTPILHEGEHYVFDITYFGALGGQLDLQALPVKYIDGRKVFHLKAAARTTSIFSLFYRLNDVAESYIDADSLFSHRFHMKLDESLQQRDLLELYDQQQHSVYYYSKWERKNKGNSTDQFTGPVDPFTQDSLSAFFYVRTLPLEIGKPYQFPVCTNGKMKTVQVTAVRKENLVTKAGEFPAIVVKPEVVLDGVLQTKGDTYIWYSDDEQRSLLKIDAKIKIGSVIAYLHELNRGTEQNVQLAKP